MNTAQSESICHGYLRTLHIRFGCTFVPEGRGLGCVASGIGDVCVCVWGATWIYSYILHNLWRYWSFEMSQVRGEAIGIPRLCSALIHECSVKNNIRNGLRIVRRTMNTCHWNAACACAQNIMEWNKWWMRKCEHSAGPRRQPRDPSPIELFVRDVPRFHFLLNRIIFRSLNSLPFPTLFSLL